MKKIYQAHVYEDGASTSLSREFRTRRGAENWQRQREIDCGESASAIYTIEVDDDYRPDYDE